MDQPFFKIGQIFRRSQIHNYYGGNRQAGISFSANHPYIFIFSGQSGRQHGYKDQWENEDVFSYSGEGQVGDMQFIRGNLALRDHLKTGKTIFLFIHEEKAFVKYEAELKLIDFDFFISTDREGNDRTAIKFFFQRVGSQLNYIVEPAVTVAAEDGEIEDRNTPNETERRGLVTSRVGQGAYRKSILYRRNFRCAVTRYSKREILIASHIVPWRYSTNEERLDVNNGILLSPTYDALFDQHLISFENNGKIILSHSLSNTRHQDLGVSGTEIIKDFLKDNYPYLERHRQILL